MKSRKPTTTKQSSLVESNEKSENVNLDVHFSRTKKIDSKLPLEKRSTVLNDLTNKNSKIIDLLTATMAKRKQTVVKDNINPQESIPTTTKRLTRSKVKANFSVNTEVAEVPKKDSSEASGDEVNAELLVKTTENALTSRTRRQKKTPLSHSKEEKNKESFVAESSSKQKQTITKTSNSTPVVRTRSTRSKPSADSTAIAPEVPEALSKDSTRKGTQSTNAIPSKNNMNNLLDTQSFTEKSPVRQTRSSQASKSPVIKTYTNRRSSLNKSTEADAAKPKNTTLERWLVKQTKTTSPAQAPLIDGTRKSTRLVSKSNSASPVKLRGKTSPLKRLGKSPATGSSKKMTGESKKVPVYKTEPKPDFTHSAPDDIYGFECDPSDRKPAKKKRIRKAKGGDNDLFQPSKLKTVPQRAKQPSRSALKAHVANITEPPKTVSQRSKLPKEKDLSTIDEKDISTAEESLPSKNNTTSILNTTDLLQLAASKLADVVETHDHSATTDAADTINRDNTFSPIAPPSEEAEVCGTLMNESDMVNEPNDYPDGENLSISHILAAAVDEDDVTERSKTSILSRNETDVDHCFGFDDENSPVPKKLTESLIKSTPLKQQAEKPIVPCFSSVSPVLKISNLNKTKPKSRPARLDQDVAMDLIRGIRPLHPIKEKQKQPSLKQFTKEVEETQKEDVVEEQSIPLPTPPTTFRQPPRRSYSKHEIRRVKRNILPDEDEEELGDEEENIPSKPKRRAAGKATQKKKKRNAEDKEIEEFYKKMNSHFQEIASFDFNDLSK